MIPRAAQSELCIFLNSHSGRMTAALDKYLMVANDASLRAEVQDGIEGIDVFMSPRRK